MFARILEIVPKMEKKEELIQFAKKEVLPILRKQHGFLEILPFLPEVKNEKHGAARARSSAALACPVRSAVMLASCPRAYR